MDIPDTLLLSDLYEGDGSAEIRVKVLRDDGSGDILAQYVRFCKISDSQRKLYGATQKAIDETLKKCMEEDILTPFLASRKKEVLDIMVTLFDQEKIWEIHDYNVAKDARQEGLEKGREESLCTMITMLQELSLSQETVIQKLISKFGLAPHVAEKKVKQYWVQ